MHVASPTSNDKFFYNERAEQSYESDQIGWNLEQPSVSKQSEQQKLTQDGGRLIKMRRHRHFARILGIE